MTVHRTPQSRTRRIFRCGNCGHKLRFGSLQCGSCWVQTPFYNRKSVYVLGPVVLLVCIAGAMLLTL